MFHAIVVQSYEALRKRVPRQQVAWACVIVLVYEYSCGVKSVQRLAYR